MSARSDKYNPETWDLVIASSSSWWNIPFREIWRYRDLLWILLKRDYKASFRQTILGPIWFFIQPIFTTLIYTVVFNRVAKLGTDGMPPILFYLSGVILWNYFSTSITSTSNAFISNASIFGKVYFPRLIIPISIVLSNMMKLMVQFSFFVVVFLYYLQQPGVNLQPTWHIVLFPFLFLLMGILGLSIGMLISTFTTKYRDFQYLISFGIQLLMYATPIVYPSSMVKGVWHDILVLNPMTGIVEGFRFSFLGSGSFQWGMIGYSLIFSLSLLVVAVVLFNKVEKKFMDTV
jgi:lipopolysaccharide transport system permease protein